MSIHYGSLCSKDSYQIYASSRHIDLTDFSSYSIGRSYDEIILYILTFLQLCLEAALKERLWRKAMAILFVMDRHVYWLGESKQLLEQVKYIVSQYPGLPVPPQIVIREARLLKDEGAVQEADRILSKVLAEGIENS